MRHNLPDKPRDRLCNVGFDFDSGPGMVIRGCTESKVSCFLLTLKLQKYRELVCWGWLLWWFFFVAAGKIYFREISERLKFRTLLLARPRSWLTLAAAVKPAVFLLGLRCVVPIYLHCICCLSLFRYFT